MSERHIGVKNMNVGEEIISEQQIVDEIAARISKHQEMSDTFCPKKNPLKLAYIVFWALCETSAQRTYLHPVAYKETILPEKIHELAPIRNNSFQNLSWYDVIRLRLLGRIGLEALGHFQITADNFSQKVKIPRFLKNPQESRLTPSSERHIETR